MLHLNVNLSASEQTLVKKCEEAAGIGEEFGFNLQLPLRGNTGKLVADPHEISRS